MTEQKTFTFTAEQIKDIFRAGIRAGESGEMGFHECVDAVYDIVNENTPDYTEYSTVEEWFK